MHDLSDIYRMEWKAVKPTPSLGSFVVSKLAYTLLITIVLSLVSWQLDLSQQLIIKGEVFVILVIYILIYMIVINLIWYSIIKVLSSTTRYQINLEGISIDNKNIDWKHIKQYRAENHKIVINTQIKSYTLFLEKPTQKTQAVKALDHYLKQVTS